MTPTKILRGQITQLTTTPPPVRTALKPSDRDALAEHDKAPLDQRSTPDDVLDERKSAGAKPAPRDLAALEKQVRRLTAERDDYRDRYHAVLDRVAEAVAALTDARRGST